MEYDTNTPQPAPQATPSTPAPKKGHGGLVAFIVIIIVVIAALVLFSKKADDATQPASNSAAESAEQEDLSSLEAELEATTFEGVSEGL
jgi:uncharacterized protein YpmB